MISARISRRSERRSTLACFAAALCVGACGAPTQAGERAADADAELLWTLRLPGEDEPPLLVEARAVPIPEVPRASDAEAERDPRGAAYEVMPGALYVYLRAGVGGDELVLVGPRSDWVAGTEPRPTGTARGRAGAHAAALPLARGRSASIALRAWSEELVAFADRVGLPSAGLRDRLAYSVLGVDVVWPAEEDAPTARFLLLRGSASGDPASGGRPRDP